MGLYPGGRNVLAPMAPTLIVFWLGGIIRDARDMIGEINTPSAVFGFVALSGLMVRRPTGPARSSTWTVDCIVECPSSGLHCP